MALLEVKNLKVYYFTRKGTAKAVDGVNFSIDKNETLGLIGESGCGKTTTALSLMRFVTPPGRIVKGKIVFDGRDIISMSNEEIRLLRGKEISIVFQAAQNALNPVMTIEKQISEGILEHESITEDEALERAKNQLNLVGIGDERSKSYPHELSGGMKQRVMIAMATVCNPKLLILDEPVTGLDVIVQRQILSLINDLRAKLHLTIVIIAHDLSVIAETCDKIAVMYAGKIVEQASAVSLYKNPMHPYSQALIKAYPSIKGEKKKLKSIPGAPPRLVNPPPGCKFHPRCSYAADICRKKEPIIREKEGHLVACHLN
ncbi:ABC transporter ATP-binding protein [Candidatus Aerophobetes bacterium]|nr:ABC transporter ATP-binding protein [Candidatus Aerophobetes bacterium]